MSEQNDKAKQTPATPDLEPTKDATGGRGHQGGHGKANQFKTENQ